VRLTEAALPVRMHRDGPFLLLAAPLILFLCAFYAYPVAAMLLASLHPPAWSFAEFVGLAGSHVFWRVMEVTGEISLIVTLVCLLLAWPLAYGMARLPAARANLLMVLVLVPFWTSILVRTYAWMALLGRRGIINNLLLWSGLIPRPLTLLNTRFSVCVAMVHVLLPFMVLPIYATLRGLDWRLARAADSLGATPWGTLRQIVLPLSLPGTAAGVIFVFVLAIGFYITPVLVGGPSDVMISILINDEVGVLNWPIAAAMAAGLLAVVLLMLGIFARVVGVERIARGAP